MSGCTSLGALNGLNTLSPGDRGVHRAANGVPLGADPRQRLDVWAPTAIAAPLPVVVFFYGGSWNSGARADYAFAARALAARGFVVVVPDYRLVPQVRFPAFVEDGALAVAWTAANIASHGGDPARIAVMGHSAGAHIAMLLALDRRYGASGAIKAVVGLAGPYDFRPFTAGGAADLALGQAPNADDTQPISFARPDAPPVLLLSGDEDTTVMPANSTRLAAALTTAGSTAQTRLYPGIGHAGIIMAMSKPFRGKAPVMDDVSAFLAKTLG